MGATGTVVRVNRAHHRHLGTPCVVDDWKTPPEQKLRFNQGHRRWAAVAIVCWVLLVMISIVRVAMNHAVQVFESSSSSFDTSTAVDHLRLQGRVRVMLDPWYMADFDYDVPPVKRDDTLIEPKTPASSLVVLVLSKRDHFQRRSMIRNTWGKAYASALYFVIGGSSNSTADEVQQLLLEEQFHYRDLLDTVHPDSYRSLPHKMRFAIRWVMTREPKRGRVVQWILKVDDDMYVRSLNGFVRHNKSNGLSVLNSSFPIVIGQIQYQTPVQRHGKWAEDISYYQHHPIYPPWPRGSSGYLMSRSAALLIAQMYSRDLSVLMSSAKAKIELPRYQGEDTSLGIWLEGSNVSWINSSYFVNHGRCLPDADNVWSIGHRITPELMQKCYEAENKLVLSSDSPPSIVDTTVLEVESISQNQRFTNTKGTSSQAVRSAMLHNEIDQKAILNQNALEQRKRQREAKRHELQMLHLSSNKLLN